MKHLQENSSDDKKPKDECDYQFAFYHEFLFIDCMYNIDWVAIQCNQSNITTKLCHLGLRVPHVDDERAVSQDLRGIRFLHWDLFTSTMSTRS